MTLLSICRSVAGETGWPVMDAVASNSELTAVQLFAIANTELNSLSEMFDWPHLEVDYIIPTVKGTAVYSLPGDFRKIAFGSLFNANQYYRIRGSMSTEEWQVRKHGLLGNLSRTTFRIAYPAGLPVIELTPTPVTAENAVLLYYSTKHARDSTSVAVPQYTVDSDVSRIPERLVQLGIKWRFRRAKGLDFSAELAEYNATVNQQYTARKAPQDIPIGGRRYSSDLDGVTSGYVPDNGFG